MLYDNTPQTNNYNPLKYKTTLPFILYHYWIPNGAAPKFAFEYSSLIDNVEIWYKLYDKNNVVKTGKDHISAQKDDKGTDQIIITDLVNNTEFYKYSEPPSCLKPNNSDLNYMYH